MSFVWTRRTRLDRSRHATGAQELLAATLGAAFLARLAAPAEIIDARRIALVVAHPDDEAVGVGGQLDRLQGVSIIHVTDGAPHDMTDARNRGFETREAYAAARRSELEAAVGLAGVSSDSLVSLGIADQDAAHRLASITRRLADLFAARRIEIVLTHPYEGGHPDHDATAFAVHAAATLLRRRGITPPVIIEMASYYAGPEYCIHQRFAPDPDRPETIVVLDENQRALKRGMLAAHTTQAGSLWIFTDEEEHFRMAPRYDFSVLPNGGRLHYACFGWNLTGERWVELARKALAELSGPRPKALRVRPHGRTERRPLWKAQPQSVGRPSRQRSWEPRALT